MMSFTVINTENPVDDNELSQIDSEDQSLYTDELKNGDSASVDTLADRSPTAGSVSTVAVTAHNNMGDVNGSTENIIVSPNSGGCSKFLKTLSKITLEPMLFLKMIAEANFSVVADTLEIDRVCRINLGYDPEDCDQMDDGNHTDIQTAVQRYQNTFNYYQTLTASLLPLLVVLFVGSLSDRYGRKPPMVAVLVGFIILGGCYLLVSINESWPVEVLFAGTLGVNITGTWVVFNMAVYSYVADITSSENRTKRMGILDFCWYVGYPLGTLLGGWLHKFAGYAAVFTTSTVLWTICLLYTIVIVKESRRPEPVSDEESRDSRFGPLRHVIALFRTGFRKRPGRGRMHLLVLLGLKLAVFLVQGHQVYQWSRVMLKWGPTEYSTWATADSVIHQVGMVAWVWLAEKRAFHDCTTLTGGIISVMMWSVLLALITKPELWWIVIIASFAGMLEGSMEPAIRSLITTVVGSGEAGRVLALMGLIEAGWLAVDSTIYTSLYNACIETFTQINFVVQASIALSLIPVVILLRRNMTKHAAETSNKSQ